MSRLAPLSSNYPLRPLKFVAPLRGVKVDVVPAGSEYIGLEQIESWTGKLSGAELHSHPEGGANLFCTGDVLFGKLRPYLAKAWTAERDGYCTAECLVLVPENADARFVRYCLLTQEVISSVDGSTFGSKMPRADWTFIGNVQIPVPHKQIQTQIANALDEQTRRIDALIAEKARLRTSLDEWGAAELTRICMGADSAAIPTGNPWIPRLPAGWKLMRLKHLIAGIEQGWSPECEAGMAAEGEWGVLKAGAANGGTYRETEHKALPAALDPIPELEVRQGDVLITRASGSANLVGSFAYVYKTRAKLMLSDKNFRLRFSDKPELLPELLAWMCNTRAVREQVLQYVSGADGLAKNIGSGNLREIWLAVPPRRAQVGLVEQLKTSRSQLEALNAHLAAHIERLREYRSSLISAAVTGQLDINSYKEAA